ncbi:MAG: chromosome segregation protein SMC, partial [Massilioclostridium sp.]|nr:chromosome segregation protein SMC [Massilioclostridium sp.]
SELVSFAPEYRPVIENLLGKTVVVEDLDDAVSIAKQYGYRFRIVTLDGQLVNAGGSLTGGSQNKNTGLLSRKNEIKQLTQEAEQLSAKRGGYEETLQGLNEKINRAKAELQGILSELTVLNEDQIRFEGDQKRLKLLTEQSEQTIATLAQEQQAAQKRVQELSDTIQSTREKLETVQRDIEQAEQRIDGLKGSRDDLGQRRRELDNQINALRIRQAELAKDRQNRLLSLEELDTRSSSNQEAIESLRRTVEQRQQANQEIEQEIEQCNREIKRLTDRQAGVGQEIEQMLADKNRSELATTQLRQQEREQSLTREKLGQELARLEERKVAMQKEYDNVIAKMWEEYQVSPNEAQRMAVHFDDPLAAQGELGALKGKIKALGNVNLGAIEEYKEVSERYEFMNVQLRDIESSKRELEKLIQDLTDNMKHLFVTTFDRINTEFQKVFVELFGGGRASLSLADPEEVLDCGIEISVQPPGKIIKNLSSLSGGEKAFIAIAIYFAILKVSPSPFCILDEIEAALDDVNVNKFASYLKNIDEKTQFIVITHRR